MAETTEEFVKELRNILACQRFTSLKYAKKKLAEACERLEQLEKELGCDREIEKTVDDEAILGLRAEVEQLQAKIERQQEGLKESSEIFSKKLREIKKRQTDAKDGLNFVESRYWGGVYHQFFALRMEIERMLDKKKLNEFCILMAFMTEEKKKDALANQSRGNR